MNTKAVDRSSKYGALFLIRNLGLVPQVVFDVGAQIGTFELYECFPEAAHVLIEPIAEHEPALIEVCAKFPNATHIIAAAAASTGTTQLRINKDLRHSSIVEDVIPSERHIFREIPTIALDDLVAQSNLQGPFVIKIDVDGREVDVLQGAKQALKKTEYAIIESTLFGQIYDVMDFMRSQGFVVYDIVELAYRPLDGALWQVDMAFVKENSIYRKDMRYE